MLLSFSAKRTNGQMGCHKRDNLKVKYSCIANNLMTVYMARPSCRLLPVIHVANIAVDGLG